MLTIALLLSLGQCNGTSCSRPVPPAVFAAPPIPYEPAFAYVAQEAHHATYAAGACSGQSASYGPRQRRFRVFGGLFAGRRGGCR